MIEEKDLTELQKRQYKWLDTVIRVIERERSDATEEELSILKKANVILKRHLLMMWSKTKK